MAVKLSYQGHDRFQIKSIYPWAAWVLLLWANRQTSRKTVCFVRETQSVYWDCIVSCPLLHSHWRLRRCFLMQMRHVAFISGSSETVKRSDAAQKSIGGNPEASGERSICRNPSGKLLSINISVYSWRNICPLVEYESTSQNILIKMSLSLALPFCLVLSSDCLDYPLMIILCCYIIHVMLHCDFPLLLL